jgi:nucleoside-diphosphate-sugar epimerase
MFVPDGYSKSMGILVTGGAGFIGGHTLRNLKHDYPDIQIRCLDNLSTGSRANIPEGVEFIHGDVCDLNTLNDLVADSLDGVIHLAADSRVLPSLKSPELAKKSLESNLNGTLNVITSILNTGKRIPLVYAGSSTAYGDHLSPQGEELLPRVQSPYSAGKLAGELMIRSYVVTFGLWATTLRYFQVYGPGQPSEGSYALVTGIFLKQAKEGKPLTIEGDGSQSRDFVHVVDVARANVAALKIDGKGEPINIGTGKSHTVKNLADLLSPNQVFLPPRRIDLPATQSTTQRAKELLSWESTISLEKGMRELLGS